MSTHSLLAAVLILEPYLFAPVAAQPGTQPQQHQHEHNIAAILLPLDAEYI